MGFGIAAVALALGAYFLPIGFNLVTSWIALACATVALSSRRGLAFAAVTWLTTAANLLLLNSLTRAALLGTLPSNDPGAMQVAGAAFYVTLAAFLAPILAFLANRRSGVAMPRNPGHNNFDPSSSVNETADASSLVAAETEAIDGARPVTLPSSRLQSPTVRLLLVFGLVLGAAGVLILLQELDSKSRVPEPSGTRQPI